jgi:Flp pilus assembly protein TadD
MGVGERVLSGHVRAAEGRYDDAVEALREAVRREDALLYGEPPEWTVPTRQDLGEVLLEAGRPEEAEAAFREDLDRFPRNGWSLHGLATALRAQGRDAEAATVEAELEEVWTMADTPLPGLGTRAP